MPFVRHINGLVLNTAIKVGLVNDHVGVLHSEYDVRQCWDVRTASSSAQRVYLVSVKQRLTIATTSASWTGPVATSSQFGPYPIMATQSIIAEPGWKSPVFYLEDYSPKTLNASVNTTQNQGKSSGNSNSSQHTSGSSLAVANSFEFSVSGGVQNMLPSFNESIGIGASLTQAFENSSSYSEGQERGSQADLGASMSIKDWSSYAYLDPDKRQPTWIWGQEFPWNVIDFRTRNETTGKVNLPEYVQKLMLDEGFLFPPSQIAQFGLNFVASAIWLFCPDAKEPSVADETVDFRHMLNYCTGTHQNVKGVLEATLTQTGVDVKVDTATLNLPVMSLEPIGAPGLHNGAVVGFVPSEFIVAPRTPKDPFRLKSAANNVYVSDGKGFEMSDVGGEPLLTASLDSGNKASFEIRFKVTDPNLELSLHLKHWRTKAGICRITFTVNGSQKTIVRSVDSARSTSGSDNITTVILRNRDYTSPEYYDYLAMGLNTIKVEIAPAEGNASAGYALRALAIQ